MADPFEAWLSFAVGDSETEPGGEEGGWSLDTGADNPTYRGLEKNEVETWIGHPLTDAAFRALVTRTLVGQIADKNYWQRLRACDLRPAPAVLYMDGVFNGGGIANLQTALNALCNAGLQVDGVLGPATNAAIDNYTPSMKPLVLVNAYTDASCARYTRLAMQPRFAPFLADWLGRLGRCKALATTFLPAQGGA